MFDIRKRKFRNYFKVGKIALYDKALVSALAGVALLLNLALAGVCAVLQMCHQKRWLLSFISCKVCVNFRS